MVRPPRLDQPGLLHHVMNRGARHASILADDVSRLAFLSRVSELPLRFGVQVHGYAIMPNHYHLMLRCPEGGLSRAMAFLQSRYSRWLNQAHAWDGPVWRGRFKNRVVEDEDYWRHLLVYIHLNPVEAGLVRSAQDYPWSSHAAYVGRGYRPDWLSCDDLLDSFGGADVLQETTREVRMGRDAAPSTFDEGALWLPVTSTVVTSPRSPREALLGARWPVTEDEAWDVLEDLMNMDRAQIERRVRGRGGNAARAVAMWWIPRITGQTQAAYARSLGISPALLSLVTRRVRQGFPADPLARRWVERLSEVLPGDGLAIEVGKA